MIRKMLLVYLYEYSYISHPVPDRECSQYYICQEHGITLNPQPVVPQAEDAIY